MRVRKEDFEVQNLVQISVILKKVFLLDIC